MSASGPWQVLRPTPGAVLRSEQSRGACQIHESANVGFTPTGIEVASTATRLATGSGARMA